VGKVRVSEVFGQIVLASFVTLLLQYFVSLALTNASHETICFSEILKDECFRSKLAK